MTTYPYESFSDPSFTVALQLVREDVGVVPVCIRGGKEAVSVRMLISNSSSASAQPPNRDYVAPSQDVVRIIPAGEVLCFNMTILDDNLKERMETIEMVLVHANNSNISFSNGGTIQIIDNDISKSLVIAS